MRKTLKQVGKAHKDMAATLNLGVEKLEGCIDDVLHQPRLVKLKNVCFGRWHQIRAELVL